MKQISDDDKWGQVKDFYQTYYKMKFKDRPSEEKVSELYNKMRQVGEELSRHHFFHKFKK
jgi:hypothetical protein